MRFLPSLCLLALLIGISAARPSFEDGQRFKELIRHPKVQSQLQFAQDFMTKGKEVRRSFSLGDISVKCALCGIVVNEIEGFVAENLTLEAIENFVTQDICSFLSGDMKTSCINYVQQLPDIVNAINAAESVSKVCVDLGECDKPFAPTTDPVNVPNYVVNLDLPPTQRWTKICSIPQFQQDAQYLVNTVTSLLLDGGMVLGGVGRMLNEYLPVEYAQEIQGCAQALGVDYGWVTLLNLGYEVSDACTSIVAQTTDGKILHARNLDFWAGMGFTDTLKNMTMQVEFQKGGKQVFSASTFAGYIGVLSGMKPNGFVVTIDTRFYPGGIGELFYEIIAALTEDHASLVAFLTRDVLENKSTFDQALDGLSNGELIADVYYTLSGVAPTEGAVISRNRHNATDVWRLDAPTRWFEVETNYDHWNNPPWFDDRRVPANNAMNAMGQANATLEGMYHVLSIKPVFNLQTTYSILASAGSSYLKTWTRYCQYPCVE